MTDWQAINRLRANLGREPTEAEISAHSATAVEEDTANRIEVQRRQDLDDADVEARTMRTEFDDADIARAREEANAKIEEKLETLEAERDAEIVAERSLDDAEVEETLQLEASIAVEADLKNAEAAKNTDTKALEAAKIETQKQDAALTVAGAEVEVTRMEAGAEYQAALSKAGVEYQASLSGANKDQVTFSDPFVVSFSQNLETKVEEAQRVPDLVAGAIEFKTDTQELSLAFGAPADNVASMVLEEAHTAPTPHAIADPTLALGLIGVATVKAYQDLTSSVPDHDPAFSAAELRVDEISAAELRQTCDVATSGVEGRSTEEGEAVRNTYAAHSLGNPDLYPSLDAEMDSQLAPYLGRLQIVEQHITEDVEAGHLPLGMSTDLRVSAASELVGEFIAEHPCASWREVRDVAVSYGIETTSQSANAEVSSDVTSEKTTEYATDSSYQIQQESEAASIANAWEVAALATTSTSVSVGGGML